MPVTKVGEIFVIINTWRSGYRFLLSEQGSRIQFLMLKLGPVTTVEKISVIITNSKPILNCIFSIYIFRSYFLLVRRFLICKNRTRTEVLKAMKFHIDSADLQSFALPLILALWSVIVFTKSLLKGQSFSTSLLFQFLVSSSAAFHPGN